MAQPVKVLACEHDGLSSCPGTHLVGDTPQLLQVVLRSPPQQCGTGASCRDTVKHDMFKDCIKDKDPESGEPQLN